MKVHSRVLTLSVYDFGMHRTEGKISKKDIKYNRLSFKESLVPIMDMIQQFYKEPLGTKILIRMEKLL